MSAQGNPVTTPNTNEPFVRQGGIITRPWLLFIQGLANKVNSGVASYQSGKWTPGFAGDSTLGTPTYVVQVGTWEKFGRLVVARFAVEISAVGGMAGNLLVGPLPFFSNPTITNPGSGMLAFMKGITLSASYTQVGFEIGSNYNYAEVVESGSAQISKFLPISGVASSSAIYGTLLYAVPGN